MAVANLSYPLVPVCDVLINGQLWTAEEKAHITRVSVAESLDKAGELTLEFFEPFEYNQQPTWLDDLQRFAPGGEVEIKMGYAGELETLMVADIIRLEPSFSNSQFNLIVTGYDRRYKLQRGRKTHTFQQKKASDIAAQIAKDARLTAETTDSQVIHDYLLQDNKSDWEFLSKLAQDIKYEVRLEGKKLLFCPAANTQSAALTLSIAADLLDFSPRLSAAGQVTEVIVRGWDPKAKKRVIGRAGLGDKETLMGGQQSGDALAASAFGAAPEPVSSLPVMSQAEADQMAKAMFNQRLLALVTGSGTCLGRTDLRPGKVIKIEGVLQPFDGQYYVTNVTHSYSPQDGYRTRFSVKRSAV